MNILRTAILSILFFVCILFMPWWLQILVGIGCVLASPYPGVFLILAFISDTVFSVGDGISFGSMKLFFMLLAGLIVRLVLIRYTRLAHIYDKKA